MQELNNIEKQQKPFVQRLIKESNEIQEKIKKLNIFLLTPTYKKLTFMEKFYLKKQLKYMILYKAVVDKRIDLAVLK